MATTIGIDIGSTSIKVTVVHNKTSKILFSSKLNHSRTSFISKEDRRLHEQNPIIILTELEECIKSFGKSVLESVSAVAICGQMHGVVLWSNNTRFSKEMAHKKNEMTLTDDIKTQVNFITNLITWQDKRCDETFLKSLPESKSPLATGYGCATLFWLLRNQADVLRSAEHAGSIMDLLVHSITTSQQEGVVVTSEQIAHSWGFYDLNQMSWQHNILQEHGFPVKLLPEIKSVSKDAGFLKCSWHGIPKGTQVKIGLGDFQCSVLSSVSNNTSAVLNFGTASQLAVIIPKSNADNALGLDATSAIQCFPYFGELCLAVAASLNGGNIIESFVSMLKSWLDDLGLPVPEDDYLYSKLKELCERNDSEYGIDHDNGELLIHPTLNGERHNPNLRADVLNIDNKNVRLETIIKQLLSSIINNLFEMMPLSFLERNNVRQIICSGTSLIGDKYLQNVITNLSGLPCILKDDINASYGAALVARSN